MWSVSETKWEGVMTFKEFKSRLAVGTLLRHVRDASGPKDAVRAVVKVQSNGLWLEDVASPGKTMWMSFERAADITADDVGFKRNYPGGAYSEYRWLTLEGILADAERLHAAGDWQGCVNACDVYFRLRGDLRNPRPEPKNVPSGGRTWDGDHVATSLNRASLLERDGPAYKNYN